MRLEKVRIKGFRNFDDTEVIFQKKHLLSEQMMWESLISYTL